MRRKVKRQEIDTLYIMGAGCSRALSLVKSRKDKNRTNKHTTPLDKDFLKIMGEHTPLRGWQGQSMELLKSNWLEKSNYWSQGLESSIIKSVAHYDMLSSIHGPRSGKKANNSIYLNHLSHLITLSFCFQHSVVNFSSSSLLLTMHL